MEDWNIFVESVPWFVKSNSKYIVGDKRKGIDFDNEFISKFSFLSKLLSLADCTSILIDEAEYELFAWTDIEGYRIGWLCPVASKELTDEIFSDHNLLLNNFGGIIERFNEPDGTWLLNMNDALTVRESLNDASFIEDYRWSFDDEGVEIPIALHDFYSIACEENGNRTLCDRKTGHVLFWAPDHSFDHITVYENCPEFTLYSIDGVFRFGDWVENIAKQWLSCIAANA